MKTLISTFGISPGGIIAHIKQIIKQNGCEKLILLRQEKLPPEAKNGLKEIDSLLKQLEIKLDEVIVSPYNLMENVHIIKELIKSEKDNEVIINVTGGRKTLSLAATLAGFVSNPKKIVYVQEEDNKLIEIPKLTMGDKLLSQEKRTVLEGIKEKTTINEITKHLKKSNNNSNEYHNVMKHLRELADMGLIRINDGRPYTYSITPSGELLR
ncbi:MAG: CRISPR-associated CARF protein Csa3 [bacterium]